MTEKYYLMKMKLRKQKAIDGVQIYGIYKSLDKFDTF